MYTGHNLEIHVAKAPTVCALLVQNAKLPEFKLSNDAMIEFIFFPVVNEGCRVRTLILCLRFAVKREPALRVSAQHFPSLISFFFFLYLDNLKFLIVILGFL